MAEHKFVFTLTRQKNEHTACKSAVHHVLFSPSHPAPRPAGSLPRSSSQAAATQAAAAAAPASTSAAGSAPAAATGGPPPAWFGRQPASSSGAPDAGRSGTAAARLAAAQPRIIFYLGSTPLSATTTVFQAVTQQQMSAPGASGDGDGEGLYDAGALAARSAAGRVARTVFICKFQIHEILYKVDNSCPDSPNMPFLLTHSCCTSW